MAEPSASPTPPSVPPKPVRTLGQSRGLDALTVTTTLIGALAIVAILVLLLAVLVRGAWPAMQRFGLGFLTTSGWNPSAEHPELAKFGALPLIYGTLVSSLIALVIAVPVSVLAAVFLVRLAPRWVAEPVSFLIELLAAIPSITYGFWGLVVLCPLLQHYVEPALQATLGRLPVVGALFGDPYPASLLAAGVILAIMITPIITSVTRDVLRAVPRELEEGAYGLGATWWQVMRLILSYGYFGIFGAVVLGLARAIGETMAVTMVIGNNSTAIKANLQQPGQTMASILANEFAEASSSVHRETMIYVALVLMVMTVAVNLAARLLVRKVARR